jgi:small subunit ribosomal protein S13
MARLAGRELPDNKKIKVTLTYIFGIGVPSARKILADTGIDPEKRTGQLTDDELSRVASAIDKGYEIEGALRRQLTQNIARLKKIQCYRGVRHAKGLPVRGQRTKTNARTRKGPRKTVAGKKSVKELG